MIDTPIEFIAWDKQENKMNSFYPLAMGRKLLWCTPTYGTWEYAPKDRFILMQLTALRSINDEPIYNHMIVKDEKSGDLFCVDMFYYNLMAWLGDRRLEIVGNRFQHPELLELCK